jgi:hypothetical protein
VGDRILCRRRRQYRTEGRRGAGFRDAGTEETGVERFCMRSAGVKIRQGPCWIRVSVDEVGCSAFGVAGNQAFGLIIGNLGLIS